MNRLIERGVNEYNDAILNQLLLSYSISATLSLLESKESSTDIIRWDLRRCLNYAEKVDSYLDTFEIMIEE